MDNIIVEEWLQWQKEIHIPAILSTGLFYKYFSYELLEQNDIDGKTFVIQFLSKTKENYDQYIQMYANAFRDESMLKWGNQFIAFRSLLQNII